MQPPSARFWIVLGALVGVGAIAGAVFVTVLGYGTQPQSRGIGAMPSSTYRIEDFQVVYPITLGEILQGQLACPSVPEGYRPGQTAVGEEGYHHGDIFIDARVDPTTCDAVSQPTVKKAKSEILRWWIKRCEGDYTLIGKVVKFQRPGDMLREILITKDMVDTGCKGFDQARELASSPQ